MVCRDPKSSGWPKRGRKAESVEEGEGWRAAYRAYSLTGRTAREVMTLADAIREYIREHREGGTRRNTIKCDSVALNLLLKVYDGGERDLVSELEPARLQKEFRQRLRTGQAPATLAGYKISLKKFGRWIGGKKFGKKLVKGLKVGKVEARRKGRAWTPQELRKLRDAADRIDQDPKRRQKVDRWYRMVLELGLATGARVGELFAIRWENFSPDVQLVHIEEQLQPITKDAAEPLKSSSAVRTTTVLETWAPFHRRGIEGRVLEGTSGRARSVAFTFSAPDFSGQ